MDEQVFRRTTWRIWGWLAVSVAALAFCAFAAIPSDPIHTIEGRTIRFQFLSGWRLWGMVGFWSLMLAGSLLKLKVARHVLRVASDGLSDGSSHAGVIGWSEVTDVALDGSERGGYRLALSLVGDRRVEIDIDGIENGASAVFAAVHDQWTRARAATATGAQA